MALLNHSYKSRNLQGKACAKKRSYNDSSWRHAVHIWGTGRALLIMQALIPRRLLNSVILLQDPVTGSCYNDVIMLDSRSWQWVALEVMFCCSHTVLRCCEATKDKMSTSSVKLTTQA